MVDTKDDTRIEKAFDKYYKDDETLRKGSLTRQKLRPEFREAILEFLPTAQAKPDKDTIVTKLYCCKDCAEGNADGIKELKGLGSLFEGNTITTPSVDENTSDGYHTFKELYDHRIALFIALINTHIYKAIKSKLHNDGSAYDGWFIVQVELPTGQISYHLPLDHRDKVDCEELAKATERDGHTAGDVVKRLLSLAHLSHTKGGELKPISQIEVEDFVKERNRPMTGRNWIGNANYVSMILGFLKEKGFGTGGVDRESIS